MIQRPLSASQRARKALAAAATRYWEGMALQMVKVAGYGKVYFHFANADGEIQYYQLTGITVDHTQEIRVAPEDLEQA